MSVIVIAIMTAAMSPLMEERDRDIFVGILSEVSVLDGIADREEAMDRVVVPASVIEVEVGARTVLVALDRSISTLHR